jgi:hypothetical protein
LKGGDAVGGIEIKVMLVSFIWVLGLTRILESFGALWVARKHDGDEAWLHTP